MRCWWFVVGGLFPPDANTHNLFTYQHPPDLVSSICCFSELYRSPQCRKYRSTRAKTSFPPSPAGAPHNSNNKAPTVPVRWQCASAHR
eukprot:8533668-Alexandrium_andersonii.AAC.1